MNLAGRPAKPVPGMPPATVLFHDWVTIDGKKGVIVVDEIGIAWQGEKRGIRRLDPPERNHTLAWAQVHDIDISGSEGSVTTTKSSGRLAFEPVSIAHGKSVSTTRPETTLVLRTVDNQMVFYSSLAPSQVNQLLGRQIARVRNGLTAGSFAECHRLLIKYPKAWPGVERLPEIAAWSDEQAAAFDRKQVSEARGGIP